MWRWYQTEMEEFLRKTEMEGGKKLHTAQIWHPKRRTSVYQTKRNNKIRNHQHSQIMGSKYTSRNCFK